MRFVLTFVACGAKRQNFIMSILFFEVVITDQIIVRVQLALISRSNANTRKAIRAGYILL